MERCTKMIPFMKRGSGICQLMILLLLTCHFNLTAGTTGKIVGKVTDKDTGEGLPGANIVIVGTVRGASTDANGNYVIINLPPGIYKLSFSFISYATTLVENLRVSVDRTTRQNMALSPEAIAGEEVTIVAQRPVVEMDRTHTSSVVSSETVDLMPVTEIEEVIELQAGVVATDGALHFRGGRGREVSYIIDGVPVTNAFDQSGGNNVTVENSMIEELEVISGTFNAEYGGAQSGIVNIVTKRPSRNFSGNVRVYSGEWTSKNTDVYLGVDDFNPLAEKDVQFSLSGPLFSDKLGFFVTGRYNNSESLSWFERRFTPFDGWKIAAYQRWIQDYRTAEAATSQAIAIPDSLGTGDGERGPLTTGFDASFTAKLSYFVNPKLSFSYHFFGSDNERIGGRDNSGQPLRRYQPDEAITRKNLAYSHFFRIRHSPKENFFYNLAFSFQHNEGENFYRKDNKLALFPGDDGIQPITASASGFSIGGTGGFYTSADGKGFRNLYSVNGDFNWQMDKYNFIKAGFNVTQHEINVYERGFRATPIWQNNQFPLRFTITDAETGEERAPEFHEYWDFLNSYWQNWEANFDADRFVAIADSEVTQFKDYDINPLEAAFYLQDKLEFGEIIINAGLRLAIFKPNERFPVNLRTEAANLGKDENLKEAQTKYRLSPRLGISFPISDNGAFHASYGHFFQMPSFELMFNEPLLTLTRLQLEGRRLGNADLKPEQTIAYEIGLQQGITEHIAIDVTAYYKDFRNLLGIERVNTIDAVGYTRFINRDYGNTKGISVSISTAGFGLVSGGINYSVAFANGSSSDPEALELIQTSTQIGGEPVQFVNRRILSLDWDQRHTLNAFVNFSKPANWSLGIISFFNSGVPFSPTFGERFDIAEREFRNGARRPMRWSVDLKAKKHFNFGGLKSAVFLKIDNLIDHLNQEKVHDSTGRADEIARLPENEELEKARLEQEGLFTLREFDVRPDFFSSPRRLQLGYEIFF